MTLSRRRAIWSIAALGGSLALGQRSAAAAPLLPLTSANPELAPSRAGGWSYGTSTAAAVAANLPAALVADAFFRATAMPASAPSQTPTPTATMTPMATALVSPVSTPAANGRLAGRRIGIQAGHYRTEELPLPFKTQTGATGRGLREAQVTLPIAQETAKVLSAAGAQVDVLPAGIPKGYRADLVVAVHTDGGPADRRGYFVDYSARSATTVAEQIIARHITEAYRDIGIPNVFRGTQNSRYYYGYSSVDLSTPMVLIETGFLTNAQDQNAIIDRAADVGARIANGVLAYLAP